MIYHILTQNKQKNWTGEHYSRNKVLCTNVLLKYCVNLGVNYALAIQLQRATRIESWILSAFCPSQQRKNRGTHCDFDVIEAGKRCPNRLSSEGLLSTKIINNSLSLNILNILQTVITHNKRQTASLL
jgi:hypothetical protein